jgi:hypothetical protein
LALSLMYSGKEVTLFTQHGIACLAGCHRSHFQRAFPSAVPIYQDGPASLYHPSCFMGCPASHPRSFALGCARHAPTSAVDLLRQAIPPSANEHNYRPDIG